MKLVVLLVVLLAVVAMCQAKTCPNYPIEWVPANKTTAADHTQRALVVGHDYGARSPLWAIRAAPYEGALFPGKFAINFFTSGYIPYDGKEIVVQEFEILLAHPSTVKWAVKNDGLVPPKAIPAGNSDTGELLYICRFPHMNTITPGMVHPSRHHCYISYGNVEIAFKDYEVLCRI